MKKRFAILLLVIITTLSSCTKLMMIAYDIHQPEPKSKLEVLNYFNKKKMATENILFIRSENDWLKLGNYGIELICFDKNNNFYWYKDTSQCNAPAFSYCENICDTPIPKNRINPNFKLDSLLSMTEDYSGNSPTISDADYTVVIGCGRFCGKLNIDHVKVWEEALKKSNCKIKIYKLCLDPLKQWGSPSYKISDDVSVKRRNKKR